MRKKEELSKETILQVDYVVKILEKIKEIELEKDIHIDQIRLNELMITKNQLKLKDFSLQGNYNYYVNNYHEAIKWYDKLLESDPNNALILFNKGLVFYHIQNFGKAIGCLDKALEIQPDNPLAE